MIAAACLCAGCATISVGPIKPQDEIYPKKLSPDAPLVLAIPGLRIPGIQITQEQHFGRLVELLADEGIPCRILTYDTAEHPLVKGAALFNSDLAISWTRVGPEAVHALQNENERRAALHLPMVRKVVFIGYSQGAVLMSQLAYRIFYNFRNSYDQMVSTFGGEWEALKNDPEFIYFMNALEDYLVLKNIKIQRENEFRRDPDMRAFFERAEKKVYKQFDEFRRYIVNPAGKYPGVTVFEPAGSPKYPKRYHLVKACAESLKYCPLPRRRKVLDFFIDYAEYRAFLDVAPSFLSITGSYFGSPRANRSLDIFRWFPFLKPLAGRELTQIQQTQLGSSYHFDEVEKLVILNKDQRYPVDPDNTLFLVGANGRQGDGLVDQSSAHLSDHAYEVARIRSPRAARKSFISPGAPDRLPDLMVAPLRVEHLPVKILWGLGGKRYGAAYMVKGNPGLPYLLSFVRGDWKTIEASLRQCKIGLRQFMLELSTPPEKSGRFSIRQTASSGNVRVDGRYDNPLSKNVVWTGYFVGPGQQMNPTGPETSEGDVTLEIRVQGTGWMPLKCAVYPGCNTFVKLE